MDVTDHHSVTTAAGHATEAARPGVELLVNNAGTDQFGFFKDTYEELWQRIVDINLLGVMRATTPCCRG